LAPHDPFDLASLDLLDARLPPAWLDGGSAKYLLGTDDQGRDLLSAIMYGARISLAVGCAAVLLSMVVGVSAGLLAGYVGGVGSAVCEVLAQYAPVPVEMVGVLNHFGESGEPNELIEKYGMGRGAVIEAVKKVLTRK
jgi:peptide/nickel transport system permease protein